MRRVSGICLLTLQLLFSACGKSGPHDDEKAVALDDAERKAKFALFASQQGASVSWRPTDSRSMTFSATYQLALNQSRSKPIAFNAMLEDVAFDEGHYWAKFFEQGESDPMLYLVLEISPETFQTLAISGTDKFSSCFVAAKDITASLQEKQDGPELEARGRCVAIQIIQ